jgi:hypothetical protein
MAQPGTAYGDIAWNLTTDMWNTTQMLWNILQDQMYWGGSSSNTANQSSTNTILHEDMKHRVVSLYVEVFKTHLGKEEQLLLERAGIKITSFNKKEIKNIVEVSLKEIKTSQNPNPTVKDLKKPTLKELLKRLDIKIK